MVLALLRPSRSDVVVVSVKERDKENHTGKEGGIPPLPCLGTAGHLAHPGCKSSFRKLRMHQLASM